MYGVPGSRVAACIELVFQWCTAFMGGPTDVERALGGGFKCLNAGPLGATVP